MDYKGALKNITKSCCDICKDDKGNILIIKKKEKGNPSNPTLYINDNCELILQRNSTQNIILSGFEKENEKALRNACCISVVEIDDNDNTCYEYDIKLL